MPWITENSDGVILTIKATPRASKTEITGTDADWMRMRIKAPPVDGKANEELSSFFAKQLKLPKRSVEIITGGTSRLKRVKLGGVTAAMVKSLLPLLAVAAISLNAAPCVFDRDPKAGKVKQQPPAPETMSIAMDGTATQNVSNTLWDSEMNLFETQITVPPAAVTNGWEGFDELLKWHAEGTADLSFRVLYAERTGRGELPEELRHPSVVNLQFCQEMAERQLNVGLPNTLFAREGRTAYHPVVATTSAHITGRFLNMSLPMSTSADSGAQIRLTGTTIANQIFFAPAFDDYRPNAEDRFPANLPTLIATVGGEGSEIPFAKAAIMAIQAMRPNVRESLIKSDRLGFTLNMLFRRAQKTVVKPDDYLTAKAHPAAFRFDNLDVHKLLRLAHDLSDDIPPPPMLQLVKESQPAPGTDFFDIPNVNEFYCISHFCIGRVFRGKDFYRTYTFKIPDIGYSGATLQWVVLQGDTNLIRFIADPEDNSLLNVRVGYHQTFRRNSGDPKDSPLSSRVDIAAIMVKNGQYSMPSIISVCFLPQETRLYSQDRRILCIDYDAPQPGYKNPMLTQSKHWRDDYVYDSANNFMGWIRTRGMRHEYFTPQGLRIVSRDAQHRPHEANKLRYYLRTTRSITPEEEEGPIQMDVAAADDNQTFVYRYDNDQEMRGKPEPKFNAD